MNMKIRVICSVILLLLVAHPCFADESIAETEAKVAKAMTEECRAFASQPDADLGEVIKAGC